MGGLFVSLGAGPGMGYATAERFAAEGYDVMLMAREETALQPLAERLRQTTGRPVETAAVDVTDEGAMRRLAERLGDRVEVVHFNVGLIEPAEVLTTPAAVFWKHLQVDVGGAYVAIQVFAPKMMRPGRRTILLTGGGVALEPDPKLLSLSVGKAGLRCMVQALFRPMQERGLHLATLTVYQTVAPDSPEARRAAELNWKLHAQAEGQWTWERSLR